MNASPTSSPPATSARALWPWLLLLVCLIAAAGWLLAYFAQETPPLAAPQAATALTGGVVARMDSPVFRYSPGWRISAQGADPREPDNPWTEPSGRVTFAYRGRDLALQLAVGAYWGYIYVTVDGAPANRLARIPGNTDSQGLPAGYRPLLAPERQTDAGPAAVWTPVHRAADDGPHEVVVEVWRSWGQIPLRAVAVDALPAASLPLWPVAVALLVGLWGLYFGWRTSTRPVRMGRIWTWADGLAVVHGRLSRFFAVRRRLLLFWSTALLMVAAGVVFAGWPATDAGLALLILLGLLRPELWAAALLFGLPFYLHPLPILPGRALNLIEIGVWGGLVILASHRSILYCRGVEAHRREEEAAPLPTPHTIRNSFPTARSPISDLQSLLFFLLLSLALVSALAAQQTGVALREWRTLFLAAGGFALLLGGTVALSDGRKRSQRVLVAAWLAGGTVVALVALWQFVSGSMIIQAEGVTRVRGLYGSPNNLALYLERTLAVGIGDWGLGIGDWGLGIPNCVNRRVYGLRHTPYAILLLPQLLALVLTFSKGALFLGIPAMLLVLAVGGAVALARRGQSRRFLWWLAAIGAAVVVGVLPFWGTDRFRLLFDLGAGTTGGLRLNLWRSAWAMALDHPWLGVGPDNFLYAYRSGYILPAAWQDPSLNHPHNFVLDWWTRLGLPGLLLAAFWLGTGVRRLWRGLQAGEDAPLALGCLAAIAAALAHGLIDASYALPDLMLVWVFLLHTTNADLPMVADEEE